MPKIPLYKCPFTHKVISEKNGITCYLRYESKKQNISRYELRFLVYLETFGNVVSKEKFTDLYENKQYTLPMFYEEFGMVYSLTQYLIKYHNVKKRTRKENSSIIVRKNKVTNLQRYGVDQTFKVKEFGDKRRQTYIDRYGVDNPFKCKNFLENIELTYIKKYGHSLKIQRSIKSKEAWRNKTLDERSLWLDASIRNPHNYHVKISKLETYISTILSDLNIKYTTQFKVNKYFFDFYIPEINLLIEVNGDWSHANPKIYKHDDIIPRIKKTASERWSYDKEKIDSAKDKGYNTWVLWEDVMKENKSNLELFVLEKLIEYATQQNQKNNKNI